MVAVIVDVNPYHAIVDISAVDAVIEVIGAIDKIPGAPLLATIVGTVIVGQLISRPYPAVVSTGYLCAERLNPSSAVANVARFRRNVDQVGAEGSGSVLILSVKVAFISSSVLKF